MGIRDQIPNDIKLSPTTQRSAAFRWITISMIGLRVWPADGACTGAYAPVWSMKVDRRGVGQATAPTENVTGGPVDEETEALPRKNWINHL